MKVSFEINELLSLSGGYFISKSQMAMMPAQQKGTMIMNANERLTHWASSVSSEHTSLAIERAENAVIDTIACMLIGSQHPVTERILAAVAQWGNGNSTIIVCQHKTAAPWVNRTSAHAIDFDDYNETPSFTTPARLYPLP
jgi:2-methylcitrate dehydratase PrpD